METQRRRHQLVASFFFFFIDHHEGFSSRPAHRATPSTSPAVEYLREGGSGHVHYFEDWDLRLSIRLPPRLLLEVWQALFDLSFLFQRLGSMDTLACWSTA